MQTHKHKTFVNLEEENSQRINNLYFLSEPSLASSWVFATLEASTEEGFSVLWLSSESLYLFTSYFLLSTYQGGYLSFPIIIYHGENWENGLVSEGKPGVGEKIRR